MYHTVCWFEADPQWHGKREWKIYMGERYGEGVRGVVMAKTGCYNKYSYKTSWTRSSPSSIHSSSACPVIHTHFCLINILTPSYPYSLLYPTQPPPSWSTPSEKDSWNLGAYLHYPIFIPWPHHLKMPYRYTILSPSPRWHLSSVKLLSFLPCHTLWFHT